MQDFIIMFLCLLISIRGVRIYLRTGLKGELIGGLGISILMLAYFGEDIILVIIGFVISNVGWLILFTYENELCREIYGKATIYERIIGDVPIILNENESRTAFKLTGVLSGLICFLAAFELYKKPKTNDIVALVEIGVLILAGILFIFYYLFKKV